MNTCRTWASSWRGRNTAMLTDAFGSRTRVNLHSLSVYCENRLLQYRHFSVWNRHQLIENRHFGLEKRPYVGGRTQPSKKKRPQMSYRKLLVLALLAGLVTSTAACSDVTAPE